MATIQELAPAPWRKKLVRASFAGVRYHVEQQARSSGRRVVLHEYPKRDEPYSEDMGRSAIRYQITGYLVSPSYNTEKEALIRVLESSEGGPLIDPYIGRPLMAVCEKYSVTETRQRGGYCTFEMQFVELGKVGNTPQENTGSTSAAAADTTASTAAGRLDQVNLGQAPSDWPTYGGVEPFPDSSGGETGGVHT